VIGPYAAWFLTVRDDTCTEEQAYYWLREDPDRWSFHVRPGEEAYVENNYTARRFYPQARGEVYGDE